MTKEQTLARLFEVAFKDARHPHYARTVALAKRYAAFATGEGIDAYMKVYSRRESPDLFKARCEITHQITPSVVTNLFAIAEKAYRSHYRRELRYTDDTDGKRTEEFEKMLGRYAGGRGVDEYCQSQLLDWNTTDPNAWVVQEWKPFDPVKNFAEPYPLEVPSEYAVDFRFELGTLQYLTVISYRADTKNANALLAKLTCYQSGFTSTFEQIGKSENPTDADGGEFPVTTPEQALSEIKSGTLVTTGAQRWLYKEYQNGLKGVQAMRVGYKRDLVTRGETFVWPIVAADPYLNKTLKTVSELDITAANAAFPITIRYGDDCAAPGCESGYVEGMVCRACEGTGKKKSPTSAIEEIVISPMPESPDQILDLKNLYTFISPDVAIIQWQQQYVEQLKADCKAAVLNSDLYDRKQISETATGKSIEQDNANDFVYKYFKHYAAFWQFVVLSFADITSKGDSLNAQIVVSKDLKLKTLADLMAELESANRAGVSPAARQSIEWDIMRILSVDAPEEFAEWQVREKFNPFSGYTTEEKIVWAQSPLVPLRKRVLYANMSTVFERAEQADPKFYILEGSRQREIIETALDEIMEEIDTAPAPEI